MMTTAENKIKRMSELSYVLGMLEALKDLPRGRHAMAWYSIQCGVNESPDGELCVESDIYNDVLQKKISELEKAHSLIWEEVKDIDQNILRHINTLETSLGYAYTFLDAIERIHHTLQNSFIDMGADNPELVRGRALSVFENIDHQLDQYKVLIVDLKDDAKRKIKKALAAVVD